MEQLYPFLFKLDGMTQSYLWGGDKLRAFGKPSTPNQPLAEVWEVSDRPEDDRVSVIANGPLAGKTLRWLMEEYQHDLLGAAKPVGGKFPLLVKLLDAKLQLSLQVHPPHTIAASLGGEPKTECWLVLNGSDPDASITTGLQQPVTADEFRQRIEDNQIQTMLHTLPVAPGDCMFLPSGRLHAIGAGCLILEIQENSNTTYRVFDWNRVDPNTHQARELHLGQALQSIDFTDMQPQLQQPVALDQTHGETLVMCPQFTLERWHVASMNEHTPTDSFEIITCLAGDVSLESNGVELMLPPLTTSLVPASISAYTIHGKGTYSRVFVPSAL